MNLGRFFHELKRRKVYTIAVGYIVGGWALAQGLAQVLPVFDVPNWVIRLTVLLIMIGFPVALVLSWFFDITRYGIVRTPAVDEPGAIGTAAPFSRNERSIAVLPFTDLSPQHDHGYLSEGIAEEIIASLAKIENLRVSARRSSFWFKDKRADLSEIATKLKVEHVLEGSIRRDGDRVRITAELINAADGFTIWSETFDREMQSIFAVEDEITSAIVSALKLKLKIATPARARSADAYDVYLQGRFWCDKGTEEGLRTSLELFERALQIDPEFSRAWSGIAKAWLWLADAHARPLDAYPKVRDAAVNALKINKQNAEAHVYLAETKRILDWDFEGAEKEYTYALEIEPNSTPSNYFIAAFYAAFGYREKALNYLERTSKIDPESLWVNNSACELYRYFGLYEEAIAAGERALELDPAFVYGEPLIAALYREMGRFDDAIALYEKAQHISGRPAFGLAITYARMNRRDEALAILQRAVASRGSYTPGDAVAHVYVALHDHNDGMRELDRACEEHSSSLHFVGIAPEFVPLRTDERFLKILKRIGIDPKRAFAASAARGTV